MKYMAICEGFKVNIIQAGPKVGDSAVNRLEFAGMRIRPSSPELRPSALARGAARSLPQPMPTKMKLA